MSPTTRRGEEMENAARCLTIPDPLARGAEALPRNVVGHSTIATPESVHKNRVRRSLIRILLQRFQEFDDGILVGAFQFFKLLDDFAGLAVVSDDGVEKC